MVRVVVQSLLGESLPAGGGSMKHVRIRMPHRSVVNAAPPASVAAGNVETSQRIVDVVRRLEEAGEVMIEGRGGDSELIV